MADFASGLQTLSTEQQSPAGLSRLDQAILGAVAYADVFDYPLSVEEIMRNLVGFSAPGPIVNTAVDRLASGQGLLGFSGRFVCLAGRENLTEIRQAREEHAAGLWPLAGHYGAIISRLPYVRMVAVTGALAVDNVDPGSDIDYMLVTAPNRLWLCRAFVILVVRLAARRQVVLCPNYILSLRALEISPRDLYTAHEIVQMVPLSGFETYRMLRQINRWTDMLLPNASLEKGFADKKLAELDRRDCQAGAWGEWALNNSVGSRIDRWEMDRKLRKFSKVQAFDEEYNFSPDWCRGHNFGYARKTRLAYRERLVRLNLAISQVNVL